MSRVAPAARSALACPPSPTGTIDEDAAALGLQVLQRFGGQDRNVRAQMPNSESARASSSEYGSRCSFVRNRS